MIEAFRIGDSTLPLLILLRTALWSRLSAERISCQLRWSAQKVGTPSPCTLSTWRTICCGVGRLIAWFRMGKPYMLLGSLKCRCKDSRRHSWVARHSSKIDASETSGTYIRRTRCTPLAAQYHETRTFLRHCRMVAVCTESHGGFSQIGTLASATEGPKGRGVGHV